MSAEIDASFDPLDAVLDSSAAPFAEPEELDTEVRVMLTAVGRDAPRVTPMSSKRIRARVAAGVALGVVLGGAGIAAASTMGWDWENSDLVVAFTRPDGVTCEMRFGMMATSDLDDPNGPIDSSKLDPGIAAWFKSTDVLALADVDEALEAVQSGGARVTLSTINDDGTIAESHESVLSENRQYELAVSRAVSDVIAAEVQARGLPGIAGASDVRCTDGTN